METKFDELQGQKKQRLHTYLQRDVTRSVRHLDHGVLAADVGVGIPHIYRLELAIGLLDHITIGATAHWLLGQRTPGWSPKVALAFYRSRRWEVGIHYHQTLNPPPRSHGNSMQPAFQQHAVYLLANVSFSQAWFTGGFDIGWARGREANEFANEEIQPAFFVRDRLGGGIHFRFGNRRLGVIAQATYPYLSFDLSFDVRFSLFELRSRGGWSEL